MPNLAAGFSVFRAKCHSRAAFVDSTGRWGALLLVALEDGPVRFGGLRRRVEGISDRILAHTLQALELDGLVIREVHAVLPAHVEYRLSEAGQPVAKALHGVVDALYSVMPTVLEHRYGTSTPQNIDT